MIKVSHLTKQYGNRTAVSDLNFELEDGRIYGFLGPNGAGKSTTMNMMTGCLAPTEGTVTIDGLDIYRQARQAKHLIGYLPEIPPLYPDLTVTEYLRFVAEAKKISKSERSDAMARVLESTQLTQVQDRLIRHLSKGYRQRVGIAQALLGDPKIIILDEPSVGLDPKQITEIRELIVSLGGDHTVVLSSHILSEVQAVCDHVLIIDHGKLVASGAPTDLEKQFQGSVKLELTVRLDEKALRRILEKVPGIRQIHYTPEPDGTARVELETDKDRNEQVFLAFSQAGCPILQMTTSKASLEDIFLELTGSEETAPEVNEHDSDL